MIPTFQFFVQMGCFFLLLGALCVYADDVRQHRHHQHFQNRVIYVPYIINTAPPIVFPPDADTGITVNSPNVSSNNNHAFSGDYDDHPDGTWVDSMNGEIPNGAIPFIKNSTKFYCRALYNSITYYGLLTPNDGCYAKDPSQSAEIRFSKYQILIK